MRRSLILAAGLCLALSCAHAEKVIDPHPNVDLPKSAKKLKLALAPGVQDEYKATGAGIRAFAVRNWHRTLANGFNNAFGGSFTVVQDPETADVVLEFGEALLSTQPAAVSGYYGVVAVVGSLRYKARLLDGQGNVLARLTGQVLSRSPINQQWDFWRLQQDTVEVLYEELAGKLFPDNGPPAKPENPIRAI